MKSNENLYKEIKDYSEDFDTLKRVFGKHNIFYDIYVQEFNYLKDNPNSKYMRLRDYKGGICNGL